MSLHFYENSQGFLIPKEMNMPLTSSDPWKQAEDWCRNILTTGKECVVVGLGAGFHIAELIERRGLEKVYVVDHRPGLLSVFKKQFSELSDKVEVIIVEKAEAILKHDIMSEVMEKNLNAFAFTACWPRSHQIFSDLHRHLTGRSQESLHLFLQSYGIKKEILIHDDAGGRYLTIRDLELLIQEDVPPFLRLNCFRILKELII